MNILLHYIVYPLAMGTYFRKALSRRKDVNLLVAGTYTGSWIPWKGGMELPKKYAIPPDIPLPFNFSTSRIPWELVQSRLPENWSPDLVLTVDAGVNWTHKPSKGIVATIGTDAHCLDYSHARKISDYMFNMHEAYAQKDDICFPYCFDPSTCFPMEIEKTHDAVLVGMPYEQRVRLVGELRSKGISVIFENGPIFDEYRQLNNSATLGLNWASLDDLNCRVFELMAMKLCPIVNRVTDLPKYFKEDVHYLGFSSQAEAVEKAIFAKNNPEISARIAESAYNEVWKLDDFGFPQHSYDARVDLVLRKCGLI